jgi:Fe-S-cluster containining protein
VAEPGAPVKEREWYAEGLRFACTRCGNCCTGPPGAVWFNEEEGRAMADLLCLDEATFRRRFARRIEGKWSLKERETGHGYDCIFLDRGDPKGRTSCRVHSARPTQCRTWPFWPENLISQRAWQTAKLTTPCLGMDHGRLVRIEEIRRQRDAVRG